MPVQRGRPQSAGVGGTVVPHSAASRRRALRGPRRQGASGCTRRAAASPAGTGTSRGCESLPRPSRALERGGGAAASVGEAGGEAGGARATSGTAGDGVAAWSGAV